MNTLGKIRDIDKLRISLILNLKLFLCHTNSDRGFLSEEFYCIAGRIFFHLHVSMQ